MLVPELCGITFQGQAIADVVPRSGDCRELIRLRMQLSLCFQQGRQEEVTNPKWGVLTRPVSRRERAAGGYVPGGKHLAAHCSTRYTS